jgi:hypothetical protein
MDPYILFSSIVFSLSLGTVAFVFVRKIPLLKEIDLSKGRGEGLSSGWRKDLTNKTALLKEKFESIRWELVFQKILSRVRIWALKVENKCSEVLEKRRSKVVEEEENKQYWESLTESENDSKK